MHTNSTATTRKRVPLSGLGWAALGVLAFSLTFPATVLALRGFDPYVVGAGRSVLAALLAAACLTATRAPLPAREHWPGLIAVSAGCGIGFGLLSALALRHTTSTHAAVVTGLLPAATATVAVLRLGERPRWPFWAASALGSATVVAFALSGGAGRLRPADWLLLAALVAGAVGYAEGGRLARVLPGWQVISWGVLLALPLSLPIALVALAGSAPALTASSLLGFAYLGVVSMFLGFFAWYRGLAEGGVARASQLQLAQPLLTIAWSVPLLGEHAGLGALLAAAIVGLCVLVTQRARRASDAGVPDLAPGSQAPVANPPPPGTSPRTRVRRHADRARTTRAELHQVLDAGLVAHVAFVADGHPVVLPMGYARDGETLLLHGSRKNRMLRALAAGGELCATVTLLDALVLAPTAFTHSMNYRSAVVYGHAQAIVEDDAKARALSRFVDFVLPGRSAQLPAHTRQELAATLMLAVPLHEASVKMRTGAPAAVPCRDGTAPWIGTIPLRLAREEPQPAERRQPS